MERNLTVDLAWQRTVDQLNAGCPDQLMAQVTCGVGSHGTGVLQVKNGDVAIALLDRPSPRTVTVSWSDPCGCKYGEQVWRLSIAKRSGTCALSGQDIAAGDAIYRPARVDRPPANAAAMMLANEVELAFTSPSGSFWGHASVFYLTQSGTARSRSRCSQCR